MAKKLLAVVLAVLIAVSAMAITVFADKQIPLYKTADTKKATTTYTFDIPVYGLYGYLTAGDYMKLDLPTDFGGNAGNSDLKWSVVVNGMAFALDNGKLKTTTDSGLYTVDVVLAYLTHDFDGKNTAIPQTTSFNTVSSIRLIAELTTNVSDNFGWDNRADGVEGLFTDNYSWSQAKYLTKAKAQWYKADGSEVPGSLSYVYSWNPQKDNSSKVEAGVYDFVTQEWNHNIKDDESTPLTWDHTLANRAALASAEAVELVVELNKNIVGQATYALYANTGDATYATNYNNLWWQYDASRKFVYAVSVDGKTDKLVFKVPLNILYDADLYGTYNRQFVIFENITLFNTTVMKDYLHIDRDKVGGAGAAGTMGRVSWAAWAGDRAKYDGEDINYARTGIAGKGVLVTDSTVDIKMTSESYAPVKTGIKVTPGVSYKFEPVKGAGDFPYQWIIKFGMEETDVEATDGSVAKISERPKLDENGKQTVGQWGREFIELVGDPKNGTFTFSYEDLIKAGAHDGDELIMRSNVWGGATYTEWTLKVSPSHMSGQDIGADVMAKAIYLNIKETEAEPEATPDTPTESGDNAEDVEGGEEVTVDDTPAPAPEKNPNTGVALAVVPMLVAAAAAVIAKKH